MKNLMEIELQDIDRQIWEEELDEFIPQRIIDAHTHIYDTRLDSPDIDNRSAPQAGTWADFPLSTWELLNQVDATLLPGREVHRISFGNPMQDCPFDQANEFVARQVASDPESVGLMIVKPETSPEEITAQAIRLNMRGLKPYRTHSLTGDTVECRIPDYLPEPQIQAADELGMMVMLHLSKQKAIADPDNLDDLERLTDKYPRVQWVLAHCARSYYDRPLLMAAERLKKVKNLWFEISSVCDSDAMYVLLDIAGPDRVMYGSDDIPIGVERGKYITFGNSWAAMTPKNHGFDLSHCDGQMTFTRYESLRAFRRACQRHSFGQAEIQKLFHDNAKKLIELTVSEEGH